MINSVILESWKIGGKLTYIKSTRRIICCPKSWTERCRSATGKDFKVFYLYTIERMCMYLRYCNLLIMSRLIMCICLNVLGDHILGQLNVQDPGHSGGPFFWTVPTAYYYVLPHSPAQTLICKKSPLGLVGGVINYWGVSCSGGGL